MQTMKVPDHYFLDDTILYGWGPLRLEMINGSDGTGVPREMILAVATAMLQYTQRGFVGTFNARVSSTSTSAKLWISFRIV